MTPSEIDQLQKQNAQLRGLLRWCFLLTSDGRSHLLPANIRDQIEPLVETQDEKARRLSREGQAR